MFRSLALGLALAALVLAAPARAEQPLSASPDKLNCAAPEGVASGAAAIVGQEVEKSAAATVPKVVFKLNRADDAPTVLRFVTNYLAAEPGAKVVVVGYAGGADFMLLGAADANGKPYAEQMAALAARGVDFKVCNNTLKARNLTAAAVSAPATVVPGAVNEIIRLQTREGYAYFEH